MNLLDLLNDNEGVSVFVAALLAAGALMQNAATTKASNQPFVSAVLERAPEADSQVLVITNTGRSPAHDVQVTFDPPISEDEGPTPHMGHFIAKRYAKPIPTLVPGVRLSNVYAWRVEDRDSYRTPEQVKITIEYRGLGRFKRLKSQYHLDVEVLRNETIGIASDSPRGLMKEYRTVLRLIAASLDAIAKRGGTSSTSVGKRQARRELPQDDSVLGALGMKRTPQTDATPHVNVAQPAISTPWWRGLLRRFSTSDLPETPQIKSK